MEHWIGYYATFYIFTRLVASFFNVHSRKENLAIVAVAEASAFFAVLPLILNAWGVV